MSKHRPETREEFKHKCLRMLGHPVVTINVSDDQIEDCIEEALKYFSDYHFDGTEHVYLIHEVTEDDKVNGYIPLPDSISAIVQVVSGTSSFSLSNNNPFSSGYQMAQTITYDMVSGLSNGAISNFYIAKSNYELLNQVLIGPTVVRYSRHTDKLYIDTNWNTVQVGSTIAVECYKTIDPDEYPQVWNDTWLLRYASAKIKYIWGSNLSKFEGAQLPGGITLNGTKIQDDAQGEIQTLEDDMLTNFSLPPRHMLW